MANFNLNLIIYKKLNYKNNLNNKKMMNIANIIVVHLVWQAANFVHAYFDPSPIVPMSEYEHDHRVLDCHQCFEAKGKFCHHKEYGMTLHDTKEANQGYAFCCK